jgi:ABC-type Fe3+-hydroxamate transport system substrate-binding protein
LEEVVVAGWGEMVHVAVAVAVGVGVVAVAVFDVWTKYWPDGKYAGQD